MPRSSCHLHRLCGRRSIRGLSAPPERRIGSAEVVGRGFVIIGNHIVVDIHRSEIGLRRNKRTMRIRHPRLWLHLPTPMRRLRRAVPTLSLLLGESSLRLPLRLSSRSHTLL